MTKRKKPPNVPDKVPAQKNKGGRPRIEIPWPTVQRMCQMQCTGDEIAFALGFSYDTLDRASIREFGFGFAKYKKQHSSIGSASLRRAQFKSAILDRNPTMLIWLGKQYLGQRDHKDINLGKAPLSTLDVESLSEAALEEILNARRDMEDDENEIEGEAVDVTDQ